MVVVFAIENDIVTKIVLRIEFITKNLVVVIGKLVFIRMCGENGVNGLNVLPAVN